ncbi:uncharacterized protein Pyn_12796 [Prunus yedoensis var. nudiflora]|uniref:Uncharacterized protein n=1 Tax=Prunus yedoensis var. nudiflora TaxID=2094558 RepID=A0A314XX33_PRUYE|nr:uncharacterized protein Pyn_12796 [Prunus yedoensis var. nudiflora]
MKALKEQRCEREPPVDVHVDDDDFAGLACPLDDLEAVFIPESETTTYDPSNLFHDVKLDDHNMAIQEKPKKPPSHGKGKSLETLRLVLCAPPPSSCQQNPTGPTKSDAHHQRQDWVDEEKLENSKRKLHQGYQEFQNKRKRIQLLDVKNLPLPFKPQRGRVLSENKPLTSSRKCPEPSDFSESQQNPKGLTKSTDHDLHHRQDWEDEEKLETSVRKLHQGYQEFQNKRKKIQVIDIKNLPLPSKPGRGRVLTKNKFLTSSRKCRAF